MQQIENITSRAQLAAFAERHGLREDWHEPDEQGIDAYVDGGVLDNAFNDLRGFSDGFGDDGMPVQAVDDGAELSVLLKHDGAVVASVNLATLLALAAGAEVVG